MRARKFSGRHKHMLSFAGLALAVVLFFGETIGHGFNSDDYLAVYHALRDPNASLIERVSEFARPSWGLYYRPGIKLFLESLGALFGVQPAGYHVISLICYVLLCFETYLIAFLLSNRWQTAITAAVIFMSLGVHGEAIFWISSLNGVVENILTLASLACFICWYQRDKRAAFVLSLFLFIAALLMKESAIALPIILICYSALLGGEMRPKAIAMRTLKRCWLFVLLSVVFVIIRGIVMRQAELPPPLTHFGWRELIVGPWHALLMTLSPIDWAIPVYFFNRVTALGTPVLVLAGLSLLAVALVPLLLRRYRLAFLVWWIPAAAAPLFALGLVPSERHLVISSVGASILISLLVITLAERLARNSQTSSIVLWCILAAAFAIPGFCVLNQRQNAWRHASEVAGSIVEHTTDRYPAPGENTTFFFLNVPDSIDGAFVFRFDNLEYALKLSYQDDSIEVVRIVTLDTLPAAVLAERKSAYFRISAMGGHIYRPEDYRKIPDLKQQWEAVSRLDILREDFRFVRGWNQYVDSPFLVYTGETVTPMNSRELKNIFLGLYSLF